MTTATPHNTVQDQWESFAATVIHPDAGPNQRDQMRLAFFAGAWAMFSMLTDVGETDVTEDQGLAVIEALRLECIAFAKSLKPADAVPEMSAEDREYMRPMGYHPTPTQRATRKVGRNDSCPCGSGKKFKKCCAWRSQEAPS